MARWLISLVTVATTLAAAGRVAHAQGTQANITFEQALGLAQELPELVALRQVARDRRGIALPLAWHPLQLLVTPQRRLAPSGAGGFEGSVSLQQQIPLVDLDGARKNVLERQADVQEARAAAATLESRLLTASAWIAAWRARERSVVAEREYELAKTILAVTERGVSLGVFTAPELADAKAFVAEADLHRTDAEGELAHDGFELAKATARAGSLRADGALPAVPLPAADATRQLVARARQMPAVAAKRLAARASRARAAEERALRKPQLILGGELFRDEPGGLVAGVTLGVSWPHDRGQREAREAELDARVADAEAAQLIARSASELESALHEVQHTAESLAKLRVLVPAAEDAATRRQRAVEIGESTIVELLAARRTALLARARLTDAEAAHAWARIEAWLLLEATGGRS